MSKEKMNLATGLMSRMKAGDLSKKEPVRYKTKRPPRSSKALKVGFGDLIGGAAGEALKKKV